MDMAGRDLWRASGLDALGSPMWTASLFPQSSFQGLGLQEASPLASALPRVREAWSIYLCLHLCRVPAAVRHMPEWSGQEYWGLSFSCFLFCFSHGLVSSWITKHWCCRLGIRALMFWTRTEGRSWAVCSQWAQEGSSPGAPSSSDQAVLVLLVASFYFPVQTRLCVPLPICLY